MDGRSRSSIRPPREISSQTARATRIDSTGMRSSAARVVRARAALALGRATGSAAAARSPVADMTDVYTAWSEPVTPPCLVPPTTAGRRPKPPPMLSQPPPYSVAPARKREQRGKSHERGGNSHHDEQGVEAHGSSSSTTSHSRKQRPRPASVRTLNERFIEFHSSRFRTSASERRGGTPRRGFYGSSRLSRDVLGEKGRVLAPRGSVQAGPNGLSSGPRA